MDSRSSIMGCPVKRSQTKHSSAFAAACMIPYASIVLLYLAEVSFRTQSCETFSKERQKLTQVFETHIGRTPKVPYEASVSRCKWPISSSVKSASFISDNES